MDADQYDQAEAGRFGNSHSFMDRISDFEEEKKQSQEMLMLKIRQNAQSVLEKEKSRRSNKLENVPLFKKLASLENKMEAKNSSAELQTDSVNESSVLVPSKSSSASSSYSSSEGDHESESDDFSSSCSENFPESNDIVNEIENSEEDDSEAEKPSGINVDSNFETG